MREDYIFPSLHACTSKLPPATIHPFLRLPSSHTPFSPDSPVFSVQGRRRLASQGHSEGKPPSQTSWLGPPKLLPSAYSDPSPSLGNWTRRGTWTGSPRSRGRDALSLGLLYLPTRGETCGAPL